MKAILFLDDDPGRVKLHFERNLTPNLLFVWVNDADECINAIRNATWDKIWLDHDLLISDDGRTIDSTKETKKQGMAVVDWLVALATKPFDLGLDSWDYESVRETKFIIHSWADDKAPIMMKKLQDAGYDVSYEKFKEED